jgi:CRP-like cAMP-binding protein
MHKEQVVKSLSEIPLLVGLSLEVIEKLADRVQWQQLAEGETLFRKGEPGSSMYIVDTGSLNVVIEDPHGRELVLKEAGHGEVIGEISLVDQEPRAASVIAVTEAALYRLDRDDFLEVVDQYPAAMVDSIRDVSAYLRFGYTVETLRSLPLFEGVPEDILFELASKMERVNLATDETLFYKGDPADSLYLVKSGWVKIVTEDSSGGELMLNQCGIGETIGEMSLLDDNPRSASVIALSPVEMLKLNRDTFLEVLGNQPVLAMYILRKITARLRFNTTYIEEAIELSKRVAEGDYSFAMDQIQQTQDKIVGDSVSDEARANELLSAFFAMVKGVQEREEKLKQQLRQLTIQIDDAKRQEEYEKLTQSAFFADLKAAAEKMRAERDSEEE